MDLSQEFEDNLWVAHMVESRAKSGFSRDPSSHSSASVRWVFQASRLAKSGYIQLALVLLSALWMITRLLRPNRSAGNWREVKSSRLHLPLELCSQATRAAALAFICVAGSDVQGQTLNAALIAYIFLVGLLRLSNSQFWRHVALHQVNLLLVAGLLVVAAAELLPGVLLGSHFAVNPTVLASILSLAASVLVAVLTPREWIPPSLESQLTQGVPEAMPSPEETCSWFNYYMTYGWLTPLVWKGCRQPVVMDDLPGLPWYDEPLYLLSKVQSARARNGKTLWTVFSYMRTEIVTMAVWIGFSFAVELVAPFALYQLLDYLSDPGSAVLHPGVWLFLMFAGPMARSISFQQYIFTSTRLIVRIKSGMTQELYHRAMSSMELDDNVLADMGTKLPKGKQQGQKSTSAGRLANLMASDIDAIRDARDVVMIGVGVPIGITIALIGLYRIVGWSSLVGTAIMLIAAPIPAWISQLIGNLQRGVKVAQDSRISLISEYLESVRAIKYFAWEDAVTKHIDEARGREMKGLWRIAVLWLAMSMVTELIPLVALLSIFTVYVGVLGQPLTAPVAFTTLSLTMTIRRNLGMLSRLSRSITNGLISIGRLDKYFANTMPLASYPAGPLSIRHATFRRGPKASFRLTDISADFVEGGLNVVLGQSGSGKTTLLLSILGETFLEDGHVTRQADVAFASQTAWLQNESIRDNILFNAPFEEARYDRVINACCLPLDFGELPGGDATEVGENGTALSGGQRSRIALARALYSKAPLLLLDDIFSALDSNTAASVWRLCFCSDMLRGRTTVLVTQLPWIASQADLVITLENGEITGTQQNLGATRLPVTLPVDAGAGEVASLETHENGGLRPGKNNPDSSQPKQGEIASEIVASAGAARLMFFKYMLYFGGPLYAVLALLVVVASNAALIGTSLWLTLWVDVYDKQESVNVAFYLGIYALLTLAWVLVDGLAFLAYANGAWVAAKRLHETFVRAVMNVSLSWYKNVPVGRVVNRFSRDMNSLDTALSRMLLWSLEDFVKLFFRIGAISSILPIFIFPSFLTCVIGIVAGEMYTRTAVMVKLLVSASQSPLFTQFSDTLAGLPVIRARAAMPGIFGSRLAERLRDFSRASEANYNCNRWVALRIDFVTALVALCAGMIAVSKAGVLAAGLVGFSLTNATGLSETILGLVRSMNELEVELQSFHRVREYTQLEPEEKTDNAIRPQDGGYADDEEQVIPENWPRTGSVELRDVTIRYDPEGPDILKDINLKFNAGERVAIVGRTGSGKSTLVLSLLRFTTITAGKILYDGVDISRVTRRRLRQSLTIIPQDAVLFNGTIGSNLDPSGELPAALLERTLASCAHIASFRFHDRGEEANGDVANGHVAEVAVGRPLLANGEADASSGEVDVNVNGTDESRSRAARAAAGGGGISLSTAVRARGENFSHGQRQVLSLCRALVRSSQLLLLDEATASMDYETDRGIQEVLRREVQRDDKHRTLVTIAHRLRTIADYDKVVVMGGGRVLETGSPKELFAARSHFYDMVCHSGERDDLEELMRSE